MSEVIWSPEEWARAEFGGCQLGDRRRVERAVKYAQQVAAQPNGSTPEQTESWSDCKAAYRLFDCPEVTFERLAEPHWKRTRASARGVVLLIDDTTETDYGRGSSVTGLGPTGNGGGYGYFLHSSLIVDSESERIIGLAGQEIFLQRPRKKGENTRQRTQRPRPQSEVWGRVIDQVGSPAEGVRYIHVCDRGADNLEVFCHLLQGGCGWVIRASHLTRRVRDVEGVSRSLNELCQRGTPLGQYQLSLRETATHPARIATLEVRVSRAWFPRPQHATPWLKQTGLGAIGMTILEVREVSAPAGVTPLRWVLCTDEQVATLADAQRVIHYYEQRWLIEEFHKALKTGCNC